jgi:hypothetical protein
MGGCGVDPSGSGRRPVAGSCGRSKKLGDYVKR